MNSRTLQIILGVVLVAAVVIGLVVRSQKDERSREENRPAKISAQPNTAASEHEELVRLRRELAEIKNHASEPAPVAKVKEAPLRETQSSSDRVNLAAGLVPIESLHNTGRATAQAAYATQLWAAHGGDVDLEVTTIALEPDDRAKLEALIAKLPESARADYATPERLMASLLAGSRHPVGGMEVLGETPQGSDDVVLNTKWQHEDDDVVHQSDLHFHRDADGWKLVLPTSLVDRAAAFLTRRTAGPPRAPGGG